MKVPPTSLLLVPTLFSPLATAGSFDCGHVRKDNIKFDFKSLSGPHSVSVIADTPPTITNTTWTVDICKSLETNDKIDKSKQCSAGTWICGIGRYSFPHEPDKPAEVFNVIPIAGQYHSLNGNGLDPNMTRLKTQDKGEEGLEVELHGGTIKHEDEKTNIKQKAVIKFICDKDRTGNEGNESAASQLAQRNEDDDKKAAKNSLTFKNYSVEKDVGTLRLEWRTKTACEDAIEQNNNGSNKGGWGFFTWLILLLFLGIAAYLIFGSWLNYNRYGARGWDLLPHGDTIRDIPYLFKDWSRKVVDTVSGGGSRGGYSAV